MTTPTTARLAGVDKRLTNSWHWVYNLSMSTKTKDIPVTFAGVGRRGTVPAWARDFGARRCTVGELCDGGSLPQGLSVVQSNRPGSLLESEEDFRKIFECLVGDPEPSTRVVIGFQRAEPEALPDLAPFLGRIPGLADRIDLAVNREALRDTFFEALTKLLADRAEKDVLGEIDAIADAGRTLRSQSGRLDAGRVADAFGFPVAELARQIGVSRQRLGKTPDAESLQVTLRPYERIARLRTVLSRADFLAWLHTPNEHLENDEAPIDYLRDGGAEPLADFAENMLTGAPS